MALTKNDQLNAAGDRAAAKTASAGWPGPQQHRFVYDPSHNDEPETGIAPGTVDMHGNTLLSLADFLSAHNLFRRARHSDLSKG